MNRNLSIADLSVQVMANTVGVSQDPQGESVYKKGCGASTYGELNSAPEMTEV